jgi:hypothetical protein
MQEHVPHTILAAMHDPTDRLLAHLALVGQLVDKARPPARERLEAVLGRQLVAQVLDPRD